MTPGDLVDGEALMGLAARAGARSTHTERVHGGATSAAPPSRVATVGSPHTWR
jgi:hypothetical protein